MFWNVTDIFQLGTLSNIDHSGKYTVLVPASQGIGLTIGTAVASMCVNGESGYNYILFMCAGTTLTALCIYLVVFFNWSKDVEAAVENVEPVQC